MKRNAFFLLTKIYLIDFLWKRKQYIREALLICTVADSFDFKSPIKRWDFWNQAVGKYRQTLICILLVICSMHMWVGMHNRIPTYTNLRKLYVFCEKEHFDTWNIACIRILIVQKVFISKLGLTPYKEDYRKGNLNCK